MSHWEASASHAAARFQNVRCEKCGQFYHYPIFREGFGSYAAIDEDAAVHAASSIAQARVINAIDRGVEIVPCPSCGWVQDDMVREMKRRTAQPLHFIGIALVVIAALIVLGVGIQRLFVIEGEIEPWRLNPMLPTSLAGAGVVAFVLRLTLQRRIDPNRGGRARELPSAVLAIPGKATADMLQRR
jgi:hypothetical protein